MSLECNDHLCFLKAPGTYGLMQYRLPPMQNQPGFHNMIPTVNQGSALRGISPDLGPSMSPRNYAMPPASYVGSAYHGVPGLQHPMAYHGGMMSHRPISSSPGSVPPAALNNNSVASSGMGKSSGTQVEGCYIYISSASFFPSLFPFLLMFPFGGKVRVL